MLKTTINLEKNSNHRAKIRQRSQWWSGISRSDFGGEVGEKI